MTSHLNYLKGQTVNQRQAKALAAKIAKDLFTSGAPGAPLAHRLVLTSIDDDDLGGWGLSAVTNAIFRHLCKPEPVRSKRKPVAETAAR